MSEGKGSVLLFTKLLDVGDCLLVPRSVRHVQFVDMNLYVIRHLDKKWLRVCGDKDGSMHTEDNAHRHN